jgi:hypothetical protein
MRYIVAPLMMVAGFLLIKYPVQVTRTTGPIGFAEKLFSGFGGTYFWWRLVGFGILMLGLLWFTGIVEYKNNSSLQLPGTDYQQAAPLQ